MAVGQNVKIVKLAEYMNQTTSGTTLSEMLMKDETSGLSERELLKSIYDRLGTMQTKSEDLINTISIVFKTLNEFGSEPRVQETAPIIIEHAPLISEEQHATNLDRLNALRTIVPDTEDDFNLTAE